MGRDTMFDTAKKLIHIIYSSKLNRRFRWYLVINEVHTYDIILF